MPQLVLRIGSRRHRRSWVAQPTRRPGWLLQRRRQLLRRRRRTRPDHPCGRYQQVSGFEGEPAVQRVEGFQSAHPRQGWRTAHGWRLSVPKRDLHAPGPRGWLLHDELNLDASATHCQLARHDTRRHSCRPCLPPAPQPRVGRARPREERETRNCQSNSQTFIRPTVYVIYTDSAFSCETMFDQLSAHCRSLASMASHALASSCTCCP